MRLNNHKKIILFLAWLVVAGQYFLCKNTWGENGDGLIFKADFDTNSDIAEMGFEYSGNTTAKIASEKFLGSTPALKISLNRIEDKVTYRTELVPRKMPLSDFSKGKFAQIGNEYWYGIRVFLPQNWESDRNKEIVMQWHGQPDLDEGETSRNPPLSLMIGGNSGENYLLVIRADSKKLTPSHGGKNRYTRDESYNLGLISEDLGRWISWVYRIRWSYKDDGLITVWKDGRIVFNEVNRANTFNDKYGPYFKFGIYKWVWNPDDPAYVPPYGINSRTIYFDDLRIGAGDVTLKDFLPNNPTAK